MNKIEVCISFAEAELDLEPEQLEALTRQVAYEMGDFAEEVQLIRETQIPEKGKSGLGAFAAGVFKAWINSSNINNAVEFLRNRFYGKALKIIYQTDGIKYDIECSDVQQLGSIIDAIERLSTLNIRVVQRS